MNSNVRILVADDDSENPNGTARPPGCAVDREPGGKESQRAPNEEPATDSKGSNQIVDAATQTSSALEQKASLCADIAELTRTQESLRISQRRLTQAMDLVSVANWEYDVATDRFTFNDRFYSFYGTTAQREGGMQMSSAQYLREFVHSGDIERLAGELLAASTKTDPHYVGQTEQRVMRRDGELRHILVRYETTCDATGRPATIFGTNQDITERTQAESALRESEEKFRQLVDNIHDVFWICSPDFQTMHYISPGYELIWGRSSQSLYADPHQWVQAIVPQERERVFAVFAALAGNQSEVSVEYRIARPDGTIRWVHDRGFQVRDATGKLVRISGVASDITDRKRIEESLRIEQENLKAIFAASPVGMLLLDEETMIVDANDVLAGIVSRSLSQIVHHRVGPGVGCVHCLENAEGCGFARACPNCAFCKGITGVLIAGISVRKAEFQVALMINGQEQRPWLSVSAEPVLLNGSKHVIVAVDDITARKTMEKELRVSARTDRLTGLPNRALFCDRLQQAALRSQRRKDYYYAVLFLDFDRFKTINDSLGHEMGDLLLQEVSRRLRVTVRSGDSLSREAREHTAARLGGDEFVVLLDGLAKPADAILVANRLLEILAQPYQLGEHKVYSTASIGVVFNDMATSSAEDVLRDADTAMYEAKLAGKGQCMVFDISMRKRMQKRLNLENDLRNALEANQLFLMYQPIVSLQSGHIERFEALVRWNHPDRGIISPGEFIPIAEDTGLILPIGGWVLREACEQFARWRQCMGPAAPPGISVNLSRSQLALSDLPETIQHVLAETGMAPDCLHLEITETSIGKDSTSVIQMLLAIKAIGVKLDIDDFGTGYSSLACLREFPVDVLKIDRSFVTNIDRGRDLATLVQAVTQLARTLKISVVAEGIETTQQAMMLRSLDCDFGQGYLFAKPLTAEAVGAYRVRPWVVPVLAA